MNFLIVMPKLVSQSWQYYIFPLGLAYISAALKNSGYSVECLNLNHYDTLPSELIYKYIIDKQIDIIGTGGISAHYEKVKEIFDMARETKPDIITVVGGGLLSSEPELMMRALDATFGVLGEGEETIVELAHALSTSQDYTNVKGLIYREPSGTLKITPPRGSIPDIDSIPYPDYEGFEIDKYLDMRLPNDERDLYPSDSPRQMVMIASRSCPYDCTFCYHPIGKKYRQRSLDSFFAEMEYLIKKHNVNIFLVLDELFSVERQRITEFCQRIKLLNVNWLVQIRVDNVDKDLLDMMRDAGCFCIGYGLESGSDTVLKSMRKHIKVSQIVHALELTYEAKIGVQGNFLFGDTAETKETAAETLELWLRLRKHNIYLIPIELYPGTEIYRHALANGMVPDKLELIRSGCCSVNITTMSDRDYLRVLLLMFLMRQSYQVIPAQVLSCRQEGLHPLRGPVYVVEVVCPHCHHTVEYRNMTMFGFLKLGCRECNRRFDLPPLNQYSEWPPNYVVASGNGLPDNPAEEIRGFLSPKKKGWPVAIGISVEGSNKLRIVSLLGMHFLLPTVGNISLRSISIFNIVSLFGKNYLVSRSMTVDDMRYLSKPIFLADMDSGVANQIRLI